MGCFRVALLAWLALTTPTRAYENNQFTPSGHIFTEWGRYGSCTSGEKLYSGLVMAERYTHRRSTYICVDEERATHAANHGGDQNGALLYTTEMEGGSSHEGWYPHNYEVGCSVCASVDPVYVRWGHTQCPDDSTFLYQGFIAGEYYQHWGGGANYLCMTQHSNAPPGANGHDHNGALLYGTEYQNTGSIDKNHDGDAACAVCSVPDVSVYTEWGRYGSCTGDSTEMLYKGVVLADWHWHRRSEFICVDEERATHAANHGGDQNGALLYSTEMEGGSSYESWYPHDLEVGCSVCASEDPVYVRWGHRACPDDSTRLYEGFIAGAHYHHWGSGANHLCMTQHSNAPPGATTSNQNGALLYGTEYQNTGNIDKNHNGDAACAVCTFPTVSVHTEWGRYGSCSGDLQMLYKGVVMADWYWHKKSEFICVDEERATHAASYGGWNSGCLLYTTEMEGGSTHESWYPHDKEVGCSVCASEDPVYVRWGHRSCPSDSTRLYEGLIAGAHY